MRAVAVETRIAGGLGLVFALLYVSTAARTVQGFDSGEAVATAYAWGVPHPPGFPVFVLMAGAFVRLLPVRPEYAVAILSAFAGAGAVVLMCTVLMRSGVTPIVAAGSCCAWALLGETWTLHGGQEPFASAHFGVALILWVALWVRRTPHASPVLALGVVSGLGIGIHPVVVMAAPPIALALFSNRERRPVVLRLRSLAVFLLGLALGLLPHFYLVWASAHGGQPKWDRISSARAFFEFVTRKEYGTFSLAISQGAPGRVLVEYGKHLIGAGAGLLPLLVALGLIRLSWARAIERRFGHGALLTADIPFLRAVSVTFLLSSFGFLGMMRAPDTPWFLGVVERFFPLIDFYAAIIAAVGLQFLVDAFPRIRTIIAVAVIAWVFVIGLLSTPVGPSVRRDILEHYANDVLNELERDSILIGMTDDDVGAIWDAQIVRGVRPDVVFVVQSLLPAPWYASSIVAATGGYRQPERMAGIRLLAEHAFRIGRPIYVMGAIAPSLRSSVAVVPRGVVLQLLPRSGERPSPAAVEQSLLSYVVQHPPPVLSSFYTPRPSEIAVMRRYAAAWSALATLYREAGDAVGAARCIERAVAIEKASEWY